MPTCKVLLAEDSPMLRKLLRGLLQTAMRGTSLAILEAADGAEAWDAVAGEAPDLVISDVEMPGLTGVELCKRIKAAPPLRHIPVILVTSRPLSMDEGRRAGAVAFLAKPLKLDQLREAVMSALASDRVSSAPGLHAVG